MFHTEQLDGLGIHELENHPPVASDAERIETGKFASQRLRMQFWMVRILTEKLKEHAKLRQLFSRELFGGVQETRTVEDTNHAEPVRRR